MSRIYHLTGTPYEIGFGMGQALGSRLEANIKQYICQRIPQGVTFDKVAWRKGALPWLRDLPERYLEEFEGLASGAGLPLLSLAKWAYIEVLLENQCSGAILILDQHAWVARNNDIFAPDMWGYVTIREVTGRIPTISFGMEGDVFTPTGINREKLWLHYNWLPASDRLNPALPHLPGYVLLQEALETCRTLQDLEKYLLQVQRDGGMLIFAVDGKTDEAALYECSRTDFRKRYPVEGWIVGTNHTCEQANLPSSEEDYQPLSTHSRYQRLEVLAEAIFSRHQPGSSLPESLPGELIDLLADDEIERRNGEIQTAYSNVACPATTEIWYTFGGYPAASQGDWQRLEWPWI